jgi:hypothetical protein
MAVQFISCSFILVGYLTVGSIFRPYSFKLIKDCETIVGMRIDRGNLRTWRKSAPVPICLSKITHGLTWDRIWASSVGSWQLTVRGMAQTFHVLCVFDISSDYQFFVFNF